MRKRERLLAVWVSYNIWKILNLEFDFFETSRGLSFLGGLSFSGVCVFEKPRGSEFSRHPGLRVVRGSLFSIHPGGPSFWYTQGVWVFRGVCVFDTTRGSEIFRGVWVFRGVCVFNAPRGLSFSGSEICVFEVWVFVTPLIRFVLHTELSNFSH